MSRMVQCQKLGKELPGLDFPPFPGEKGQQIYNNISKEAWQMWQQHQTRLINEKHLNMMNSEHRSYLEQQMSNFFENRDVDQAEGYVPQK